MSRPTVAVFGSSQTDPGSNDWEDAERAGRRLAQAGLEVVTGGYGGTMEAVSRGAAEAGGHVIGITAPILFPARSGANPFVSELIEASSLAHRIDLMMQRATATLALPGSIGTAAELLISWNTNHLRRRSGGAPFPAAAVGAGWKTVGQALVTAIGAVESDIYWADSADDGVDWLLSTGLEPPSGQRTT